MTKPTLRSISRQLNELARQLALLADTRGHVDQQILDLLVERDYSGTALARLSWRRHDTVRRTCRLLEAAGRIKRVGQKWSLV